MPAKLPLDMTLLRTRRAWMKFCRQESCDTEGEYAHPEPVSYPCLVLWYGSESDTYLKYVYPADVEAMRRALEPKEKTDATLLD